MKAVKKQNKYYYQHFQRRKVTFARKPEVQDWEVFLDQIGLAGESREAFEDKYEQVLDDFSTHLMGNIHWYEKRIIHEKTIRLAYILISLSLLLIVPILVAGIQKYTDSVTAEVTAVMTGFFALYQGLSKWLESRNGIATYWQTNSNLKSRLYSLEDKWRYQITNGEFWDEEHKAELAEDLRKAVKFGMDSQKTEKQLFFERYSYPQFNVLSTVLGVRGQVNELFSGSGIERASSSGHRRPANPKNDLVELTQKADEPTNKRTKRKIKEEPTHPTPPDSPSGSPEQPNTNPDPPIKENLLAIFKGTPKIFYRKDWNADKPNNTGKSKFGGVKSIVIHHAAGFWDGMKSGKQQVRDIQDLHKSKKTKSGKPWNDIGYHFLVDPEGNIYQGRKLWKDNKTLDQAPILISGAHVAGFNSDRIGICLLGDFHRPSMAASFHALTPLAEKSLLHLLVYLHLIYKPKGDDKQNVRGRTITGHRNFGDTSCPGDHLYNIIQSLDMRVKEILMQEG